MKYIKLFEKFVQDTLTKIGVGDIVSAKDEIDAIDDNGNKYKIHKNAKLHVIGIENNKIEAEVVISNFLQWEETVTVTFDYEDNIDKLSVYESFVDEAILLPGTQKIKRSEAIEVAKTIIEGLGYKYVDPDTVTTSYEFEPKVGIPVGSIRRKRPEVGDIDLIITHPIAKADVMKQPWAKAVSGGDKQINFIYEDPKVQRKVNIFIFTDPKSFGGALLHTTGSHQYNIRLRHVSYQRGFGKLSQHGLFDENGKFVAGPTEASIQKAMNVTQREPNQREK